jgi:hypothetical protein
MDLYMSILCFNQEYFIYTFDMNTVTRKSDSMLLFLSQFRDQ